MRSTRKITAALLLIVAAASAARAAETRLPQVSLKSIRVSSLDLSKRTADLTVYLEVDNPGPEFTVKDINYRLKLNGQQAAEGKQEKEVKIAAASRTTVEMPLTVDLMSLPAVTWEAVIGGFKLRYDLDAEFTVPVFAIFNHKIKTAFGGDVTLGDAFTSVKNKIWQLFGKP